MTQEEFVQSAAKRVAEYLEVRAGRRGLDTERVHCFDDKYELRWSDLNALVITVRALSSPTGQEANNDMA